MAEVVENTNTTDISPRRTGLISTIFRSYRKNFSLFWRIMVPIIIFSVLFDIGENFSSSFFDPEDVWIFDTARGLTVSEDPKSTGVDWGMIFGFHSFSISFLWLTMSPLIFAIVERRRDVEVSLTGCVEACAQSSWAYFSGIFLVILTWDGRAAWLPNSYVEGNPWYS